MLSSTFSLFALVCSGVLALATTNDAAGEDMLANVNEPLLLEDPFDPPNCADRVYETEVVGDGSPTKWTYWEKVSGEHFCGDGDCTIGEGQAWSWSVSFSVSGPINRWISGGFSVSAGHEKTEYVECSAQPHESVCVWFGKWHEEYTVQDIDYPVESGCGGVVRGSEQRVTSPMSGDMGEISWCGRNEQCDGDSEWAIDWYGS
ncbi:uncharacterized protein LTR77_010009 [Saxophila tyrrhenica]|uniref:Uncharacterized protein n=1 Tax=Saxophila tyrrhenica TaxID=1690608 RepID=A0AAV9NYF0_9PEZI|nr:hypothetical protein LTR77_010009 [Saxophila tyrrhenica]